MISCFAKIKLFRFWPKTMDYSQAFGGWRWEGAVISSLFTSSQSATSLLTNEQGELKLGKG